MVQCRRPRGRETSTAKEQDIEVVKRFKYLGTVINYINDETGKNLSEDIVPYKLYLDPNKSIETTK
jgi:hypothetical protein